MSVIIYDQHTKYLFTKLCLVVAQGLKEHPVSFNMQGSQVT